MKLLKYFFLFAFVLGSFCSRVEAAFVSSGYSTFLDANANLPGIQTTLPSGSGHAIVNFAVYQNSVGGNWVNDLGLGGNAVNLNGGIDINAAYVYMYQVVNIGTDISQLQVGALNSQVTSFGYLAGTTFNDTLQGIVGPSSNVYLGSATTYSPNTGATPDIGGNSSPTFVASGYLGDPTANFDFSNSSINPTSANFSTNQISPNPAGTGQVRFTFNPELTAQYSSIMFITSNSPNHRFWTSAIQDGDKTYNELPAPSAVPVPATLALFVAGLPGLFGLGMFMRRKQSV